MPHTAPLAGPARVVEPLVELGELLSAAHQDWNSAGRPDSSGAMIGGSVALKLEELGAVVPELGAQWRAAGRPRVRGGGGTVEGCWQAGGEEGGRRSGRLAGSPRRGGRMQPLFPWMFCTSLGLLPSQLPAPPLAPVPPSPNPSPCGLSLTPSPAPPPRSTHRLPPLPPAPWIVAMTGPKPQTLLPSPHPPPAGGGYDWPRGRSRHLAGRHPRPAAPLLGGGRLRLASALTARVRLLTSRHRTLCPPVHQHAPAAAWGGTERGGERDRAGLLLPQRAG